MTRTSARTALALAAALAASPLYAADANHPMPGKDTGTSRAAQPMAAGPGQSKSSDESPQSSDKMTSQGAKGSTNSTSAASAQTPSASDKVSGQTTARARAGAAAGR